MINRHLDPDTILPTYMLYRLYEEINLAAYLDDPMCQKLASPYNGDWNKECASNMSLPSLSPSVACHILGTCMGLTCCVKNDLLKRTFQIYFELDPCSSKLSIGIEKVFLNTSLTDFKWGFDNYFSLQGIVRVMYNIEDLYTEKMYLISMKIMFCFESTPPECSENDQFTILKNTMLPKRFCDWSDHMSPSGCSNTAVLPEVEEPVSCLLSSECTYIECCVDVHFIPKSFMFYIHIDPCEYQLTVGIEQFYRNMSLINYRWGVTHDLWLVGVFHAAFNIRSFEGEKFLVVSLNISICFEEAQPCYLSVQILRNTRLPRRLCSWETNYSIKNFSLEKWKQSKYLNRDQPLPEYGLSLLFEELGISSFIRKGQCSQDIQKYRKDSRIKNGRLQQFSFGGIVNLLVIIDKIEKEPVYVMSLNVTVCTESNTPCEQNLVVLRNALFPILQCSSDLRFVDEKFSLVGWKAENNISRENLTDNEASRLFSDIGLSYYIKTLSCDRTKYPYTPSESGWNNMCGRIKSLPALTSTVRCSMDTSCTDITCCVDIPGMGRSLSLALSFDSCHYTMSLQLERFQKNISLLNYEWGNTLQYNLVGVLRVYLKIYDLQVEDKYMINFNISLCMESEGPCMITSPVLKDTKIPKSYCYSSTKPECSNKFQDNPMNEESVNCVMSSCYGFICCVNTPILSTSVQISWEIQECRNRINLQIEK
ncbi:unnamed protein product [Mytilus edulis]|uniref:Uncharacterized protein n=1 Tax=Mytilus edulis TaxID=6550 RepID=A0A8S3TTX4_MYTED|nr:unnamed protein product [Mytilus edulis]